MAVRTAVCNSYMLECMRGIHLETDTYKLALIKPGAVASFDAHTANYIDLGENEVPHGAGYAAGGRTLEGGRWALINGKASIHWDDPVWTAASISAVGALIYNASRDDRAVQVISFADTGPVPIVSTNAKFSVQLSPGGAGQVRFV